jgi:hypothetical protein
MRDPAPFKRPSLTYVATQWFRRPMHPEPSVKELALEIASMGERVSVLLKTQGAKGPYLRLALHGDCVSPRSVLAPVRVSETDLFFPKLLLLIAAHVQDHVDALDLPFGTLAFVLARELSAHVERVELQSPSEAWSSVLSVLIEEREGGMELSIKSPDFAHWADRPVAMPAAEFSEDPFGALHGFCGTALQLRERTLALLPLFVNT